MVLLKIETSLSKTKLKLIIIIVTFFHFFISPTINHIRRINNPVMQRPQMPQQVTLHVEALTTIFT